MGFNGPTGHRIIEFRFDNISGRALVAGYQLCFSLRYDVLPCVGEWAVGAAPTFRVERFAAELEGRGTLGFGFSEHPLLLTPADHAQKSSATLIIDISVPAIEVLERARAGGDLAFRLHLYGERIRGPQHIPVFDELGARVNQKTWTDVLDRLGYGTFLLCEIPIPMRSSDHEVRQLAELVDRARKLLHGGHYDEAVTNCRVAMEQLGPKTLERLSRSRAQLGGDRTERERMTKKQRIDAIFAAARHCTHLGAHGSADGSYASFTREEALLVFANTAAALSVLSSDPELTD